MTSFSLASVGSEEGLVTIFPSFPPTLSVQLPFSRYMEHNMRWWTLWIHSAALFCSCRTLKNYGREFGGGESSTAQIYSSMRSKLNLELLMRKFHVFEAAIKVSFVASNERHGNLSSQPFITSKASENFAFHRVELLKVNK